MVCVLNFKPNYYSSMAHILAIVWLILFHFMIIFESQTCLAKKTPSNFVFGDSLVEVGNNNYIVSLSKADFLPNGIDFGKPTGRYTNGRTIVDIIGQELGFGFTPPYLAPTTRGARLQQGVNYASGGGGILNHTGQIFVGRINLDAQMDNFANTRQEILSTIGEAASANLFKNALFSVTIGANDFINNYLQPGVERALVTPESFVGFMISRYRIQLMRLYSMGARKIVVANVGPIGCIPFLMELDPYVGNGCSDFPNKVAQLFNAQLVGLVKELGANLEGSNFLYADVYHIISDIIQNYQSHGFDSPHSACCYVAGKYGGLIPCGPKSKVCEDRSRYVFWDPYHPTEAVNLIAAKRLLDGDSRDIWPINIRKMMGS